MRTPRFSVLIPTRDRPETLRHTLKTVATQPGEDYEIVIADNCSREETRLIVESLAAPNVRYSRCAEVLPMAQNWERGLELCSGEYVTVLGDDDGFLPSTLPMARRLIAATSAELLSWTPHAYWWPDTIVFWLRNILVARLRGGLAELPSRTLLQQFYRGEAGLGRIPMIYQAFFHRALIEEARSRYDGFFVPREAAPDIASGILGLHLTQSFVHSERPLTIRGNSGKSNGTAQWLRSLGAEQRAVYFREERMGLEKIIHPSLVPSPDLTVIVASAKLRCRDAYFPDDPALELDPRTVLDQLIESLGFEPEAYDEKVADIRALARKIGVTLGELAPPRPAVRRRSWGPDVAPDNSVEQLYVNCDPMGVSDVAGAAALAEGLLPDPERYGVD